MAILVSDRTKTGMLDAGRTFLKALGMEKSMAVSISIPTQKNPHMHMVASLIDPKNRTDL